MSDASLTGLLRKDNLVSELTARYIADHFQPKKLAKNQYQLEAGRICDEYLFLENGMMRAFAHDTDGQEVTTGFYGPGQMVFEVSSFFQRSRSKENIQSLSDCDGLFLSYEQLNQLFHSLPEFREFGRSVLVTGFAALKSRMLSTITETAEERYARLLAASPEIFQHASLKNIASFLGITDTSLSRIRKEMAKK